MENDEESEVEKHEEVELPKLRELNVEVEDLEEYDPFKHRDYTHANSDFTAVMHLFKSALGAGVFAMPKAFKAQGWLMSFILTFSMGLCCGHCCYMVAVVSREQSRRLKVPSLDYANTVEQTFANGPPKVREWSKFMKKALNGSLVCMYYGTGSVYIVYIASQTKQIVDCHHSSNVEDRWNVKTFMLMYLLPLLISGQCRNLKHLLPFSSTANSLFFISFAIVFYTVFSSELPDLTSRPMTGSFADLPIFTSIVVFSMENIGMILPLENQMKNPVRYLGCGIFTYCTAAITSIYAFVGLFGYWKYGEAISDSITLNTPFYAVESIVMKSLIVVAIYLTYPMMIYIPSDALWKVVKPKLEARNLSNYKLTMINTTFRVCAVLFTFILAISLPRVSAIMGFVGAVFYSTVGIAFPMVLDLITYWETGSLAWRIKDFGIIIIYLYILFAGVYSSVQSLLVDDADTEACPSAMTRKFF